MNQELKIQNLALELCEWLLIEYAESVTYEIHNRILTIAQDCSPEDRVLVRARLAYAEGSELECLNYLDEWTTRWITSIAGFPCAEQQEWLVKRISWLLLDDEGVDSVGEIYQNKLISALKSNYQNTSASYFLSAVLDEFETYEEDIRAYEMALKLDPSHHLALQKLATTCFVDSQFDKAMQKFQQLEDAVGLSYYDPLNYLHLAYCYARNCGWKDADLGIKRYLECAPWDEDALNMEANSALKQGNVEVAKRAYMKVIPESTNRNLWIWVTKPEYYEEDEGVDRMELDPFYVGGKTTWSCDENTKIGDIVLIYRTRPRSDIAYLLVVLGDAEEQDEDSTWPYMCDARVIWKFDKALTIQALRDNQNLTDWSILKRQFQGISFPLDRETFFQVLGSNRTLTSEGRFIYNLMEGII